MRINSDSGANYNYNSIRVAGGSAADSYGETGVDGLTLAFFGGTVNTNYIFANITIDGANAAGVKPIQWTSYTSGTSGNYSYTATANYVGTSTISSLTFFANSGTNSAAKVYIYGA
jgi:hypothetical protein